MNQHLERLDQLAEIMRPRAATCVRRCREELGAILLVVYTYRDVRLQMALYQKGRGLDRAEGVWRIINEKDVVTNALPGRSGHNVVTVVGKPAALAFDVIPLREDGSAWWDYPDEKWTAIYAIAKEEGLDPYGDIEGAYLPSDKGHIEWAGGIKAADELGLIVPHAVTQIV